MRSESRSSGMQAAPTETEMLVGLPQEQHAPVTRSLRRVEHRLDRHFGGAAGGAASRPIPCPFGGDSRAVVLEKVIVRGKSDREADEKGVPEDTVQKERERERRGGDPGERDHDEVHDRPNRYTENRAKGDVPARELREPCRRQHEDERRCERDQEVDREAEERGNGASGESAWSEKAAGDKLVDGDRIEPENDFEDNERIHRVESAGKSAPDENGADDGGDAVRRGRAHGNA